MTASNNALLWIDVTMLMNHAGHLTGIQRVEYNLAKRYAKLPGVKFCVFQKERGGLVEFDFKHLAYKIDQLQHQAAASPSVGATVAPVHLHRRILGKVKRTVAPLLSAKSKVFLRSQSKRLVGRSPAPDVLDVKLSKHDTLLILSGDWSDGAFAGMVESSRAQTGYKVVQIVYDMLPAFFPSFFVLGMPEQFTNYMRKVFANCDGILTISKSTQNDVQRFMRQNKIKEVPVSVFRLGDDFAQHEPVKPELPVKKDDYLLCVCTIESRKNHMELFYAAREALSRGDDFPQFVLVGKRGWLADDFLYLIDNDPVLSKKFLMTSCTDQELAWLYKNCRFTVFPSFYEGWGLPVAESVYYGKLCLSSNTSSMPEIAGDSIDYFSPNDPMGLLEKIMIYWNDSKALAAKEAAIKKSYKPARWEDAFSQVKEFVDQISK